MSQTIRDARRVSTRRLLLLAALGVGQAGCAQTTLPATQIVVGIDSDLEPGSELTKVEIEVLKADGSEAGRTASGPVLVAKSASDAAASGKKTLPLSLSITPGRESTVMIRVTGSGVRGADKSVRKLVEQRALVRFQTQQTQLLHVFLGAACVDKVCNSALGQVCFPTALADVAAGDCGSIGAWSAGHTELGVPPEDIAVHIAMGRDSGAPQATLDSGQTEVADSGPRVVADAGPAVIADAGQGGSADTGAPSAPDAGDSRDAGTPVPPNECVNNTWCKSPDYPCQQTLPSGYTCLGHFAEWHMPDAVLGAKYAPSYDVMTIPGVVIDNVTRLIWQKTLPDTYAGCTGRRSTLSGQLGDTCTQAEAKAYCAGLVLDKTTGWRVPTKIELESIVDHTVLAPSAAIAAVFPDTKPWAFWTSSTDVSKSVHGWYVDFNDGASFVEDISHVLAVRCVR